jgi:hypothetical protein
VKRFENPTEIDMDLRRLNELGITEQESMDSYQDIISKLKKEKKNKRFRLNFKRTVVAFSTLIVFLSAGLYVKSGLNNQLLNSDQTKLSVAEDNDNEDESVSDPNANIADPNEADQVKTINPPSFDIKIERDEEAEGLLIMTQLGPYCWELDGAICSIKPPNVEELLEGSQAFIAEKGQKIIGRLNPTPELPRFDQITITQYRLGKEKIIESTSGSFIAPEEPGRYNYLVHIQWDSEIVGEAYYGFSLGIR